MKFILFSGDVRESVSQSGTADRVLCGDVRLLPDRDLSSVRGGEHRFDRG